MSLLGKASARIRESLWRRYKNWRTNTRRERERERKGKLAVDMEGDVINAEPVETKEDMNVVLKESDNEDECSGRGTGFCWRVSHHGANLIYQRKGL